MSVLHDDDEDALKSRSLEDQMRVRDLSELIAESTGALTK
jgi:hypothetical protein